MAMSVLIDFFLRPSAIPSAPNLLPCHPQRRSRQGIRSSVTAHLIIARRVFKKLRSGKRCADL